MVYYPTPGIRLFERRRDDRIIGPVSTEQRDSVPRKANIRMQDLRHNDYTTWRFPKD